MFFEAQVYVCGYVGPLGLTPAQVMEDKLRLATGGKTATVQAPFVPRSFLVWDLRRLFVYKEGHGYHHVSLNIHYLVSIAH